MFRKKYAFKEGLSNKNLRRMYQRRARMLRRGTSCDFFRGHKKREQDVVEVLKDLIVGKFFLLGFKEKVVRILCLIAVVPPQVVSISLRLHRAYSLQSRSKGVSITTRMVDRDAKIKTVC